MFVYSPSQAIKVFPYTIDDLRRDNPNTSFPEDISEDLLAAYSVYPVKSLPAPEYNIATQRIVFSDPVIFNDQWQHGWIVLELSADEIAKRANHAAANVRQQRNQLLVESDWTQLPDAPVDTVKWAAYRQALRDVSNQPGFPWDVQWPADPLAAVAPERARNTDGTFMADDPATPDVNEAYVSSGF